MSGCWRPTQTDHRLSLWEQKFFRHREERSEFKTTEARQVALIDGSKYFMLCALLSSFPLPVLPEPQYTRWIPRNLTPWKFVLYLNVSNIFGMTVDSNWAYQDSLSKPSPIVPSIPQVTWWNTLPIPGTTRQVLRFQDQSDAPDISEWGWRYD